MKIWTAAFYAVVGLCVGNPGSIASAQLKLILDATPQCVFGGQEIQIAGQKLRVLSDAHGGIILAGNEFVWSSDERTFAKNLGSIAM